MNAAPVPGINAPIVRIGQMVCAHYDLQPVLLFAETRRQPVAEARQVAMALAHDLHGYSLKRIGRPFRRDHTTVLHALRRVAALRAGSAEFDATYQRLHAALSTPSGAH